MKCYSFFPCEGPVWRHVFSLQHRIDRGNVRQPRHSHPRGCHWGARQAQDPAKVSFQLASLLTGLEFVKGEPRSPSF
jgi:hypothetical protein